MDEDFKWISYKEFLRHQKLEERKALRAQEAAVKKQQKSLPQKKKIKSKSPYLTYLLSFRWIYAKRRFFTFIDEVSIWLTQYIKKRATQKNFRKLISEEDVAEKIIQAKRQDLVAVQTKPSQKFSWHILQILYFPFAVLHLLALQIYAGLSWLYRYCVLPVSQSIARFTKISFSLFYQFTTFLLRQFYRLLINIPLPMFVFKQASVGLYFIGLLCGLGAFFSVLQNGLTLENQITLPLGVLSGALLLWHRTSKR